MKQMYFVAPGNGNFFRKKITRGDSVFIVQIPQPSYKGIEQRWEDESERTFRGLGYSECAVPRVQVWIRLENLQTRN